MGAYKILMPFELNYHIWEFVASKKIENPWYNHTTHTLLL